MADSAAHMPLRPAARHPGQMRSVEEFRSMQVDYAQMAVQMERIQPWLRVTGLRLFYDLLKAAIKQEEQ